MFSRWKNVFRNLTGRTRLERDLHEEVRAHVELLADEKLRQGMSVASAQREARMELGGEEQVKEKIRDVSAGIWLETLLQDVKFGLRQLRKNPGFSFIAILTLALGIGANTAIFSIVQAMLLRPLPYTDVSRIMRIWQSNHAKGWEQFGISSPDYRDWKQRENGFESLAVFSTNGVNLAGSEKPERVLTASVEATFFGVFEARAVAGRTFLPGEDVRGKDGVAVLSTALSRRLYGEADRAVGRTITLDGTPLEVIGVMANDFKFPASVELWRPLVLREDPSGRGQRWLSAVGKIRAGISQAEATTRINAAQQLLGTLYPEPDAEWSVDVIPLQTALVGDFRTPLLLLWGAVALVLLMAGVNLANLQLTRGTLRRSEIAVRCALGADRRRIVQQLLVESGLLGVAGGAAGGALGWWMLQGLLAMSPANTPRREEIVMDGGVFALAFVFSVLLSVLFGLTPAWESSKQEFREALKEGGRSMAGGSGTTRIRNVLVVSEVALAVVLLCGAGVLLRSMARVLSNAPGFDAQNVLAARVAPPQVRLAAGDSEQSFEKKYFSERDRMAAFYGGALDRIATLPGVASVGAVNRLPLSGEWWVEGVSIEGRADLRRGEMNARSRVVTPGYLATMRIPIIRGRNVTASDVASAQHVAVISEAMARLAWGNQDSLGKRLCLCEPGESRQNWLTVVGVAGNVRLRGLKENPEPTVYIPFAQAETGLFPDWGMDVVVRAHDRPLSLAGALQSEFHSIDNTLPLFQLRTLDALVASSIEQDRFLMLLFCMFAEAALLLATVGVYGVIAYVVSSRTQEIGIRLALGSSRAGILRLVMGRGAQLTLGGMVVGTIGALFLTRLMTGVLYGIEPWDPLTIAGVWILGWGVAAAACFIPARRAMRVDPMKALRYE